MLEQNDQSQNLELVDRLLRTTSKPGVSELIIQVDRQAVLIVNGSVRQLVTAPITPEQADPILERLLPERNRQEIREEGQTTCCTNDPVAGRFRVSAFRDSDTTTIICKRIPAEPPEFYETPNALRHWIDDALSGLCLLVGPPNAGKSAALARCVNASAENPTQRICTFSAEYLRPTSEKGFVARREIGTDVPSLRHGVAFAMKNGFTTVAFEINEEPEDMRTAVRAAMSGMRVFATVTADTASQGLALIDAAIRDEESLLRASWKLPGIACRVKMTDGKIQIVDVLTLPRQ